MIGTVNNTPGCELKQLTGGQSGHHLVSTLVAHRSGLGGMPTSGTGWAAGEPKPGEGGISEGHISSPEVRAV